LEVEYGDVAAVASSVAGPVHLFGHSSGARYALHAAPRIPNLASLTLYDPPAAELLPDRLLAALADLQASGDREGILRAFFVDAVGMEEEDFAALKDRPIWPLMTDNALTVPTELRAARHYRFDPSELAGLTVPTMLLLGESSGPELRSVVERIAEALPRAEVVVLAGQGHGAMVSAPGLLASQIVGFVDGLRR
jgi:pimeloyl-ACP methyl ester carboxylesterase